MNKKGFFAAAVAALMMCGIATMSYSSDVGPADITMETPDSKKPKPAIFPHKKHQDALKCGDCHHGMADGKQTPYVEGMEIAKCVTCHNKDTLAGKTKGKLKLDTLKGAAHANCLDCHKGIAKADEAKKALKKCSTCHPKKKK